MFCVNYLDFHIYLIYHTIHTFHIQSRRLKMKNVSSGKVFGSVTVGGRGQVVIPAEVRKSFKIKSGDRLIVLAKHDMFSFVPADNFNQFISEATELMAKIKNKSLLAEG